MLEELRGRHEVWRRKVQFLKGSDPLGFRREAESNYARLGQQIADLEGLSVPRKKYNRAQAMTR